MPITPSDSSAHADAAAKFTGEGVPRHFPGNTVISMIDPASALGKRLGQLRVELEQDSANELAFLPPSSWHMTVCGLVLENDPATWPPPRSAHRTMPDADRVVLQRLEGIAMPDDCVVIAGRTLVGDDIRIVLEPDTRSARLLRDVRDQIGFHTGIKHPDHDSYEFHVTLAYIVRTPDVRRRIRWETHATPVRGTRHQLATPELRFFENMTAFELVRASNRASD